MAVACCRAVSTSTYVGDVSEVLATTRISDTQDVCGGFRVGSPLGKGATAELFTYTTVPTVKLLKSTRQSMRSAGAMSNDETTCGHAGRKPPSVPILTNLKEGLLKVRLKKRALAPFSIRNLLMHAWEDFGLIS